MRVGIVGASPGNGHPYSFSAIVNGFDDEAFGKSGWEVIHAYLKRQPPTAFGFEGVRITHAWTQDPELTDRLCGACRIPSASPSLAELVDAVEAVIIARDDWETHFEMASVALAAGKPVFVDKPLTLDPSQLEVLAPHLEAGRLMTTSGLRYAAELDGLRGRQTGLGPLRLVEGVVLNELTRYGIHLLEAVAGLGLGSPRRITRLDTGHESFLFHLDSGLPFTLHCLGPVAKTFSLHFFGENGHGRFDLHDNFTAFRRTLGEFFQMCQTGRPPIDPDQTRRLIHTLIRAPELAPGATLDLQNLG
jgi:hypothetical protein